MHDTISRYFKALRELDYDALVGCFAEPLEHHDPVGGPVRRTHAELRAFFEQIGGLFQSVELVPQQIFPGHAMTWVGTGVGQNGRAVSFEGIDVFELDGEGRISCLRAYWDMAPTLAELTS